MPIWPLCVSTPSGGREPRPRGRLAASHCSRGAPAHLASRLGKAARSRSHPRLVALATTTPAARQTITLDPQNLNSSTPAVVLARGHTIADVAAVTSFVPRWIEQLLARYNAKGPDALGDLRRRNGGVPSVLRPGLLERLTQPPPDGSLWPSRKVAAWMASELGLAAVLPQRGWEALKAIDWSVQKPRPRHPALATPEEREAFKKSWPRSLPRKRQSTRTRRSRSGPRTSTALA